MVDVVWHICGWQVGRGTLYGHVLGAFNEIDAMCIEMCQISMHRVMGVTRHVVDMLWYVHG